MRSAAVCLATLLAVVPVEAGAKELKPEFGDIGGVYYTDVAENREACRQAIKNKIALCRQNTSFVSNTLDRKYPGCLPLFRQQAGVYVTHFRRQTSKCDVFGSARIDDFTGFSCTVTATVVEEDGEPERGTGAGRRAGGRTGAAIPRLRGGPVAEMRRHGQRRRVLAGTRQQTRLPCVRFLLRSVTDRDLVWRLFQRHRRRARNVGF